MPFSGLVCVENDAWRLIFELRSFLILEIIALDGLEALGQVDIRTGIHVGEYN